MNSMKFTPNPIFDIQENPEFQIPIYLSSDDRISYLKQVQVRYLDLVSFLKKHNRCFFEPSVKKDVIHSIETIQKQILNVLNEYLNGKPSTAYEMFDGMLKKNEFFSGSDIITQIPKNSVFYRTQRSYETTDLKGSGFFNLKHPLDLFHPPFQKRRSVGSNRFSISGYPSLYISQGLTTSISECLQDTDFQGPFHAISLKNIRPLYFLNLSQEILPYTEEKFPGLLPKNTGPKDRDISGLLHALIKYQLVIATHTKIAYQKTFESEVFFFKSEYVIPQLLLQWVKQNGILIDGIRYCSCSYNKALKIKQLEYNFVLPVKKSRDRGYCPFLASIFSSSEVLSCLESVHSKSTLKSIHNKLEKAQFVPLAKM